MTPFLIDARAALSNFQAPNRYNLNGGAMSLSINHTHLNFGLLKIVSVCNSG